MQQFQIADQVLNVDSKNKAIFEHINDFSLKKHQSGGLNVLFNCCDFVEPPEGLMIADENIKWLRKHFEQDGYFLYIKDLFHDRLLCLLDVDRSWGNGSIHYLNDQTCLDAINYKNHIEFYSLTMLGIMFRNYLIYHKGIVIHASALKWEEKGIMFTAPSGTGKSTQARLWQDYFGDSVKILNDDNPAVKFRDGKPYVFGTPWSGSSNIHCNSYAPLDAIVLLQQSPINSIQQLSPQEAISNLIPRSFLPYFDRNMMNMACDILESIIFSVPIYTLKCRPDREAVELVYQWVK